MNLRSWRAVSSPWSTLQWDSILNTLNNLCQVFWTVSAALKSWKYEMHWCHIWFHGTFWTFSQPLQDNCVWCLPSLSSAAQLCFGKRRRARGSGSEISPAQLLASSSGAFFKTSVTTKSKHLLQWNNILRDRQEHPRQIGPSRWWPAPAVWYGHYLGISGHQHLEKIHENSVARGRPHNSTHVFSK